MILVAGATGLLGREVCRRLTGSGRRVRGLARPTSDPEALRQLSSWGVEIVQGDLRDRTSLRDACAGANAVVSTANTIRSRQEGDSLEATDQQGQLNLVEAAAAAGAQHFVFVSMTGQITSTDPLTSAKRAVEAAVRRSGMAYTVLRPGFFMEAWLSPALGFDYPNARATVLGAGTAPISWISLGDVAEFAVRSLDDPAAAHATLELGGPEALSAMQVIETFEEITGRTFEVLRVPEEALRAQAATATDSLQRAFAALMLACARGCEVPPNRDLSPPLQLRTVREYALSVAPVELPRPLAS